MEALQGGQKGFYECPPIAPYALVLKYHDSTQSNCNSSGVFNVEVHEHVNIFNAIDNDKMAEITAQNYQRIWLILLLCRSRSGT